jgi:hypothetical protein
MKTLRDEMQKFAVAGCEPEPLREAERLGFGFEKARGRFTFSPAVPLRDRSSTRACFSYLANTLLFRGF